MYSLMMLIVVVVVPSVVVLVSFGPAGCRRCAPPIYAVGIKDVFILDSLRFSALLRIHSLQPHNIVRLRIVCE